MTIPARISSTTEGRRTRGEEPEDEGSRERNRDDDQKTSKRGHGTRSGEAMRRYSIAALRRHDEVPVASWPMADPGERRAELNAALEIAAAEARAFLTRLDDDPVQPAGSEESAVALRGELPEEGEGALVAIGELARLGLAGATRSAGPRFFHFVIGGTTPAALAADWLTSSFDQNVGAWVSSPLGSRLESICLEWLRDLFELPPQFGGVLVTGGTMANFVCLAVARDWCVGASRRPSQGGRDWRAFPRSPSSRADTSTPAP